MIHKQKYLILLVLTLGILPPCFAKPQSSREETDFVYGNRLLEDGLFELAARQFTAFAELYPNSPRAPRALLCAGESYMELGRTEDAVQAFLRILLTYPSASMAPRAQFLMGVTFEKDRRWEEAEAAYRRVRQNYPDQELGLEAMIRLGNLLESRGRAEAESVLRSLVEQPVDEYRSRAAFLLSRHYESNGEYEAALALLEPLKNHPVREEDAARAFLAAGRIKETMGDWLDCREDYRKALKASRSAKWKQAARFSLGSVSWKLGEAEQALEALDETEAGGDSLKNESLLLQGSILFELGEPRRAQKKLQSAAVHEEEDRWSEHQVLLARCEAELGDFESALQRIDAVQRLKRSGESFLLKAHFHRKRGDWAPAAAEYQAFLKNFPDHSMSDAVKYHLGCLLIDKLQWYDEGFASLRAVWQDNPKSPWRITARVRTARALETLGRYEEALQMWRLVPILTPGSDWHAEARTAIEYWETFPFPGPHKSLETLGILVEHVAGGSGPESLIWFQLAELALETLRQPRHAMSLISRYFRSGDASRYEEALLLEGRCHEMLAGIHGSKAHEDSARSIYRRFLEEHPASEHAPEASFRLLTLTPPERGSVFKSLENYLEQVPGSDREPEMLDILGRRAMERDSLETALAFFNRLADAYPDHSAADEAAYLSGWLSLKMGNSTQADSSWRRYLFMHPKGGRVPETLYRIGCLEHVNEDERIRLLETLRSRYDYSSWADSAWKPLGFMLMRRDPEKAAKLYETVLAQDSLKQKLEVLESGEEKPVSIADEVLPLLADVYRRMNKPRKAVEIILKWGRLSHKEKQAVMYQKLAELEENERPLRSVYYLERAVERIRSDSLRLALADLYFRLERYQKAVDYYESLLAERIGDEVALSSRVIAGLLRQDKIPQAEVRLNIFSQTYRQDPRFSTAMAEILYEKGKALVRRKEFEAAVENFETLRRRYRDSAFVPEAELEIGRIYLVTNRIDEALKRLTAMPETYPGHPVLAGVYLNLGDHYFRSNQFDNAIYAFKRILDSFPAHEMTPLAMRYLIRVYDSIQMTDAALALTRNYIRRYPRAEDRMQKQVQIGTLLMKLNEYERAIDQFRNIKKTADPETEAEIQYWIGSSYAGMGRFEEAVFEFLKVNYLSAPTRLPWAATALYEAGRACIRMEKFSEAKILFEKIVRREGAASDLGRIARQRIAEIEAMASGKDTI